MTRPVASSKIVLLEDRRGGDAATGPAPLRRFRIARLSLDVPPTDPTGRFEYLKRPHD